MSDLAPLSAPGQGEERDEVPELPLGPSIAGAYANAALHNHTHHQHSSSAESQYSQSQSPGTSPVLPHSPGPQMHSPPTHHASPHAGSHSNVDLTMFDPEGMNRLGRTLSRMSQEQHVGEMARKVPGGSRSVASSSNETAVDDAFDLEKTLKDLIQK